MTDQQTKPARGCLFYALITAVAVSGMMFLGAMFGLRYARNVIAQVTDATPTPLPNSQLSDTAATELRGRIERFHEAIRGHPSSAQFALTAEEVNSLIASDPTLASLRSRVHVTINGGDLTLQISFPAEEVGLERLRGRYFNVAGQFKILLREGLVQLNPESVSAKNRTVPEHLLRQIRFENITRQINQNPDIHTTLEKLQSIEVREGKIVLTGK